MFLFFFWEAHAQIWYKWWTWKNVCCLFKCLQSFKTSVFNSNRVLKCQYLLDYGNGGICALNTHIESSPMYCLHVFLLFAFTVAQKTCNKSILIKLKYISKYIFLHGINYAEEIWKLEKYNISCCFLRTWC